MQATLEVCPQIQSERITPLHVFQWSRMTRWFHGATLVTTPLALAPRHRSASEARASCLPAACSSAAPERTSGLLATAPDAAAGVSECLLVGAKPGSAEPDDGGAARAAVDNLSCAKSGSAARAGARAGAAKRLGDRGEGAAGGGAPGSAYRVAGFGSACAAPTCWVAGGGAPKAIPSMGAPAALEALGGVAGLGGPRSKLGAHRDPLGEPAFVVLCRAAASLPASAALCKTHIICCWG